MWTEKLLSSVFASSSEPIFVTDRVRRVIVDCNTAAELLFGWSRAELIGQSTAILVAVPADWLPLAQTNEAVLDAGGVAEHRVAGRHRDGRAIPVRTRVKSFEQDGHKYNVVYVRDLTEIEAANERLHREKYSLDERVKELRCIYQVSDALADTERTLEERLAVLPELMRLAWQYPDRTRVDLRVREIALSAGAAMAGAPRQRSVIRARAEDIGEIVVTCDHASQVGPEGPFLPEERDLLDAVARRIGAAAERHDVEMARRRTEARLVFLSESLPLSIAISDWTTGEFLYANARARLELGIDAQADLSGLRLGSLYTDPQDRAVLRAQLERDGVMRGQVVKLQIGGETRWHSIYAELTEFEGRRAVYIVRSDITDQRNAQEAAQRSQKLQTIGQLAGGVAHDFNNLLAALSMHMELLREEQEEAGAEVSHSVELVSSVVERGASLTRQLLSFARQQVLKTERLEAGRLLDNLKPFLGRTLGTHIRVGVVRGEGEHWMEVDKGLLESAVLNLGINARDAMPGGGSITISVGARRLEADDPQAANAQPGAYVEIAVADTGTGMPPEILQRVFEPFFTTKEVGRGTGLGLSMVHGFVAQSGGFTTIDSTVGEGTTVRLNLPRALPPDKESSVKKARPAGGRETVLLVDDDDMLRDPLARSLRSLGYTVVEARGGAEALEILRQTAPDIVLSDVMMPGMLGTDLVREIRNRHSSLPILVVSGSDIEKYLSMPPMARADFCAKPFTLAEIAAKIRGLLETTT